MTRRSSRRPRRAPEPCPPEAMARPLTRESARQQQLGDSLQLSDTWQIFTHFRSDPGGYQGSLAPYGDAVETIGTFWRTFNTLPKPSRAFTPPNQMGVGGRSIKAFSLFRSGLRPTWEDPVNSTGGEICCRCHLAPKVLDELWESLVLACVGGLADEPGVVGVRAVDNSQKGGKDTQSKIEVWFRDDGEAATRELLRDVATVELPEFDCQAHAEKSTMERKFVRDLKRRPRGR